MTTNTSLAKLLARKEKWEERKKQLHEMKDQFTKPISKVWTQQNSGQASRQYGGLCSLLFAVLSNHLASS